MRREYPVRHEVADGGFLGFWFNSQKVGIVPKFGDEILSGKKRLSR